MTDLSREVRDRVEPLGLRPEREAEIVDELTQHLEDRVRELVSGGADPAAAVAAALSDLDEPGELARRLAEIEPRPRLNLPPPGAASRGRWLQQRWQDVHHSLRSLRRSPAFTATVVATLALTIGPITAVLSIGNWLLWRPTPGVMAPDRLSVIWFGQWGETDRGFGGVRPTGVSYLNLDDLERAATTLRGVAGIQEGRVNLAAGDLAPAVAGSGWVTADVFDVLGVRMAAGRAFAAEDDQPPFGAEVAVISAGLAARAFGGPEQALGQRVMLNGRPMSVIGVLPPEFVGITPVSRVDVWYPGATYGYVNHFSTPLRAARDAGLFYSFVARLAPDATYAQAQAELDVIVPALSTSHPDDNAKFKEARARLYGGLGPEVLQRQRFRTLVSVLVAIGGALLLLGCANVANVMMLRGVRMGRERVIRLALGAHRSSLVLLRLTESAMLALAGGAVGVGLAFWLKPFLVTLIVPSLGIRGTIDVPLDPRVLALTLLVSVGCGLAAGLAPALVDAFGRAPRTLADGGARLTPGTRRLRTGFAVLQLALSLALVTGALLLITTLRNLHAVDLGFDARGVSVHVLDPSGHGYTGARIPLYYEQVLARVRAAPGMSIASLSEQAPFGPGYTIDVQAPNAMTAAETISVSANAVTPQYFEALSMRPQKGRFFTEAEAMSARSGDGSPVVLGDRLARVLFGDGDPLGRPVVLPKNTRFPARELTVIGVARDIHWSSVTGDPEALLYLPFRTPEFPMWSAVLLVKSERSYREVTESVDAAAREVDPTLPVRLSAPLSLNIARAFADRRVFAWVLSLLGWIGFALAAVGLYGLLAQSVAERTREFGIRIAIGGSRGRIFSLVLRQALWIGALGTAAGLALAAFGSRLVATQLFGVTSLEPRIYLGAAIALVSIVVLAGLWPARAATRVEPVEALRIE